MPKSMVYLAIMVKEIYSKKDKKELYGRLKPYVAKRLNDLQSEYTFRELSDITGVHHTRITEAARGNYLNEATLRLLLGGEVLNLKDIKANVDLTTKDLHYLDQLVATSHPILVRRMVRMLDRYGLDATITRLDNMLRDKKAVG